ncbi:unnamed protein product, partial [Discosporangium mesarthrocarpum]
FGLGASTGKGCRSTGHTRSCRGGCKTFQERGVVRESGAGAKPGAVPRAVPGAGNVLGTVENTGLPWVPGSMPAEDALRDIETRLKDEKAALLERRVRFGEPGV